MDYTDLPTDIDEVYADRAADPSIKAHQQAHDAIHGKVKQLPAVVQDAVTLDADTAANVADPATQTGQALSAAIAAGVSAHEAAQDTGWRNVSSLLVNGWATTTSLLLRREGDRVTLVVTYRMDGSAATDDVFIHLPAGFRVGYLGNYGSPGTLPGGVDIGQQRLNNYALSIAGRAVSYSGFLYWFTDEAYPAVLPGTPA
ncbi:MAG TPA: hypothetical protein VFJ12_03695 [Segeticoccus sp.]|nr:hypothetical protein [Segeticoccus sp.]